MPIRCALRRHQSGQKGNQMHLTNKQIKAAIPTGKSPDITLPKLSGKHRPGVTPAVLFADVSRSMQLHELLGESRARTVIDMLLGLATAAVTQHGGRVVKTIGDEILALMPDADAAARAACDLLHNVEACAPHGGIKPGMHVGFHAGVVIERAGDVFGDAVNIASRLTAYAKAGQILTTTASAGAISPLVRRSMRKLGALDIRGRRDEMQVEEIAWQASTGEDTTITKAMLRDAPVASSRLVIMLGDRQWVAGPEAKRFVIGRDPCADIVVRSGQASRNHGVIEYRNGAFFYTDTSLNGSFLGFGATGESLVRRSEVALSGRGTICFGHALCDQGDPLRFQVESTEH